jgi:peptide/nickel transport system substrate-binding protein
MIQRRTVTRLVSLLVVSSLVAAACGDDDDSGATPDDSTAADTADTAGDDTTSDAGSDTAGDDTVVIAIPGTPQGIDVDLQAGPQTWTIGGQIWELGAEWERTDYPFEATVADPTAIPGFTFPAFSGATGGPKSEGNLIESCELSADGLEATYFLRQGVISPYGNEFTADDVLYKVERALALGAIGAFIHSAANATDLSKWEKVDDYTVKITGDEPMPIICSINANLYWYWLDSTEVQKHATADDPWATEWVGLNGGSFGPYKVVSWAAGSEVVLESNPDYWRGEPEIKKIIFQVVPESANRLALLQSGEVDMAEGLSPEEIASLDGSSSAVGGAVRSSLAIYAVMNNEKPPFDDPNVRKAINTAIPRDDIVDFVYQGMANRWQGVIPSIYPGSIADFDEYTYDVEKAKEFLAASDHADGFDVELAFNSGDPVQENLSVLLQTALKELNINVTLRSLPPGPHSDYVQSKEADFALWLDFPIEPDPNYGLTLLYETDMAVNYQNYSNPEVDALLKEGRGIVDQDERFAFHEELQRIVHEDAPLAWITEPYFLIGIANDLQGWGWYTTQYYRVSEMSRS